MADFAEDLSDDFGRYIREDNYPEHPDDEEEDLSEYYRKKYGDKYDGIVDD